MKLVIALWQADQSALLAQPLRRALRDAGASTLQVNLDDEAVSAAQLRMTTLDEAPTAVVGVGGGAEEVSVPAVLAAVSPLGSSLAAWQVSSREPLVAPPVADGERVDALANVAFLRRPDDLPVEVWRSRWLDDHTAVAIDTQATFGYVQDEVLEQVAGEPWPVAAVVEELFPMAAMKDFHAFYGSGGDAAELDRRMKAMMASVGRFGADRGITLVPTSRYRFDLATTS